MKTTISKDELSELNVRQYEGPIRLVSTSEDLQKAGAELRQEKVVGLDTETRPSFRKGETYFPSLVQVASSQAVYLFSLKRVDCAEALTKLLENPEIAKAGVALAHDLKQLKMRFSFEEKAIVDLSTIAKKKGLEQTGVRNLAGLFLGFRVPKGQKTTNWARVELTSHQIRYAATDAWVCRELYLCFQQKGFLV